MARYRVSWEHVLFYDTEVEADSPETADAIAWRQYEEGTLDFGWDEFSNEQVEEV